MGFAAKGEARLSIAVDARGKKRLSGHASNILEGISEVLREGWRRKRGDAISCQKKEQA